MKEQSDAMPSRSKPSVGKALLIYAVYLAIFYGVWAATNVDYLKIGTTVENTKLWYALPTLAGSASIVLLVTLFGWWRGALFEKIRTKSVAGWAIVLTMLVFSILSLTVINFSTLSSEILMWAILGGLGVGFGEEMITRGALIFGLRSKFSELNVWIISTLLFAALHIPNVIFGAGVLDVAQQLGLTLIMGSALYVTRRVSGTLLMPILLHGLWDSSIFLSRAADAQSYSILAFPLIIVCLIAFAIKMGLEAKKRKAPVVVAETQE